MKKLLFLLLIPFLHACTDEPNEDVVKQPSKEGSIETVLNISHQTGYDILTTTHKIWYHNVLDKTIVTVDTLKSLGTTIAESDEDDDGNTQKVTVPKNYELYITVK